MEYVNNIRKYIIIVLMLIYPILTLDECRVALNDFLFGIIEVDAPHYERVYKYLHKYKYAINKELPENLRPDGKYPNCIWTLWLQGEENAPQIVKNCWKSVRKYGNNRKIIILDEKSLQKYIKLPPYILEKYRKKQIGPAMLSDIIRAMLLYKYGGTWVDSTVLLTGKLPAYIFDQELFMLQYNRITRQNKFFLTTSWFIHAKPGNVIMKDLINLSFEYWKHETRQADYFLIFLFFSMSVELNPEAKRIFNKMPYVPEQFHFFIYLTRRYSDHLFEALKKHSILPMHKLSYRSRIYATNPWEYWEEESSLFHFLSQKDLFEVADI